MRLDRLIGKTAQIGRRAVRARLAAGEVRVCGLPETDGSRLVSPFDPVELGDRTLQNRRARYLMLHKPAGSLSATSDPQHPTVIDLIDEPWAGELHLAGRLDRATTGLVVLTNDSRFSEALSAPENRVPKTYLVGTSSAITAAATAAFRAGMYFAKEGVTTHPAQVEKIDARRCRLTIFEGKHHQVKRMFARFDIRVTSLHREAIGALALDPALSPGRYRPLTESEATAAQQMTVPPAQQLTSTP